MAALLAIVLTGCRVEYDYRDVPEDDWTTVTSDIRVKPGTSAEGDLVYVGTLYRTEERVRFVQSRVLDMHLSESGLVKGWSENYAAYPWLMKYDFFPVTSYRLGKGVLPFTAGYPWPLSRWYVSHGAFPVTQKVFSDADFVDMAAQSAAVHPSAAIGVLVIMAVPPIIDITMYTLTSVTDSVVATGAVALDVVTLAGSVATDAVLNVGLGATDLVMLTGAATGDALAIAGTSGYAMTKAAFGGEIVDPESGEPNRVYETEPEHESKAAGLSFTVRPIQPSGPPITGTTGQGGELRLPMWGLVRKALETRRETIELQLELNDTQGPDGGAETRTETLVFGPREILDLARNHPDHRRRLEDRAWMFAVARDHPNSTIANGLRDAILDEGVTFWAGTDAELVMLRVPRGRTRLGQASIGPGGKKEDDPDFVGDGDERRRAYVNTSTLLMSRTEVTQATFERVRGPNANPSNRKGPRVPVNNITFAEAGEFCRSLTAEARRLGIPMSFRLPNEDEWEYVCRAQSLAPISVSVSKKNRKEFADRLSEVAWFSSNKPKGMMGETGPFNVADRKSNAWGFFDFHGNVWEWCTPSPSLTPPAGGDAVIRGGGCASDYVSCRSASRDFLGRQTRNPAVGLRVIADWR